MSDNPSTDPSSSSHILLLSTLTCLLILATYLWHVNRGMDTIPASIEKLSPHRWTADEVRTAYNKISTSYPDVKPFIPRKQDQPRRYIVVGGSGLVGGWIVQHLLWRGDDPSCIRILDIRPPTRPEATTVAFIQTDVSDLSSVKRAFTSPWPPSRSNLPLTVFHTAAYINPGDRHAVFLGMYTKVNVDGTRHVVSCAQSAGASILIATSSASISLTPQWYFTWPWTRHAQSIVQIHPNADPASLDLSLRAHGTCYSYSKVQAEKIVREADDPKSGFRTGCIRPGHAIYGHGVDGPSSVSWDYLSRGGAPTWITNIVSPFVSAQNVSLAHLSFERSLLDLPRTKNRGAGTTSSSRQKDPGGMAYCVTDPNRPITYGDFYTVLKTLAHKATPCAFPHLPPVLMLLVAYALERYKILQVSFASDASGASGAGEANSLKRILRILLPPLSKDLGSLTPALFVLCTLHVIYDDSLAKEEIGYRPAITTLEGLCMHLLEWNGKIEENLRIRGKGMESVIPTVSKGVVG